jgi:hypothetical protein
MRERDATVASRADPSSTQMISLAIWLGERNRAKEKKITEMIDGILSSHNLKTG